MAAGADSIDGMGLLRYAAMGVLFGGVRAASTLGSHLCCYAWGNVLQLEKAGRQFLARLACRAPLLPGADVLAFTGIDSTQKRVYGTRPDHPPGHRTSRKTRQRQGKHALKVPPNEPSPTKSVGGLMLSARGSHV
jgi:hypothetical protein